MNIANPLPRRVDAPSPRQRYQARTAKRIEEAMRCRALGVGDVCRLLGWPNRNRLDRYLSGERNIDLYTLSQIAAALDVDPADLIPPARRGA